jgi:hypothetical protein
MLDLIGRFRKLTRAHVLSRTPTRPAPERADGIYEKAWR